MNGFYHRSGCRGKSFMCGGPWQDILLLEGKELQNDSCQTGLSGRSSTDSMTKPTALPPDRYSLPNNERHRLALHFSRNCVDWCFAGLVADSGHPGQARNYASMVIDGADLHVLSRSGDARAKNAHDGNLITFHTVKNFRELVY